MQAEAISQTEEVITDLRQNLDKEAETIKQMEELNEDLKQNVVKKEETIAELQELTKNLRENLRDLKEMRDVLALKMEEDKKKHIEELQLMKRQMGLNQEKYTKELQDNLAKVDTFKKIYGNSFYSASILYNVQCHKYQFQPVKHLI